MATTNNPSSPLTCIPSKHFTTITIVTDYLLSHPYYINTSSSSRLRPSLGLNSRHFDLVTS